ncbi:hypothetical protein [Sinorhizobium meliloti]|uniref:hypothetical protein n=1 Tax=Rhizobium meliloti TaxID=382 RepID=UPI002091D12A|nr:hypothetical protein [Sinorhizobium meliloti]MCO5966161.1 hypothetical protein [Sinorhizobium meliloti]
MVFEIIDDAGHVRAYVASHVRREADRLIVRHRETEVGIDIARIRNWCAVDEDEEQRPCTHEAKRFAA